MVQDLNVKVDKFFLIVMVILWLLEFKVSNLNIDIIFLFDSCCLVKSGKGCCVWIKFDEKKIDIFFEFVW